MSLFLLMEEALLLSLQDIAESLKALVDMLATGVTIRVKNTDEDSWEEEEEEDVPVEITEPSVEEEEDVEFLGAVEK